MCLLLYGGSFRKKRAGTNVGGGAILNELIRTIENEDGQVLVNGRELHEFLGIGTQYTKWIERMKEYGFVENNDFITVSQKRLTAQGNTTVFLDHALTLDMAKEISMIQRSPKGKQARRYFIQIEKMWNSPEMVMKRALEYANKKVDQLKIENQEMKPKALFADAVATSQTSILVGELAKILKQNGVSTGQNKLFHWLRLNGFLIRRNGSDFNMPTQKSMELGLFEIKESSHVGSDGVTRITKTPKVTGKGQQYFINKFLKKQKD